MALHRVIYITLFVIALALTQLYGGHFSAVIFLTVLAVPVISLIMAVIELFAVSVRLKGNIEVLARGDRLNIVIPAFNRFIFPCSSIVVNASMPDPSDKRNARLIFSLSPFQKRNLNLTFRTEYRGEYDLTIDKLIVYDVLKLFKLKRKLKLKKKVVVIPRIYDVTAGKELLPVYQDEQANKSAVDSPSGDKSFVRKYTDGDDIKRIHWKLSSKHEDYMVWQQSVGQETQVTMICDMKRYFEFAEENAAHSDAALEAALAAALLNAKRDTPSVICYYDAKEGNTRYININEPADIYPAAGSAASASVYSEGPDFADEVFSVIDRIGHGKTVILMTCKADEKLIKLTESISSECKVSVLVTGEAEKKIQDHMQNSTIVKFVSMNPYETKKEITRAVNDLCGTDTL